MGKKSIKKNWIVLNLNDGMWYWVEDQPDEESAIKEYLIECFNNEKKYKDLEIEVIPVPYYKDFYIELNPTIPYKITKK